MLDLAHRRRKVLNMGDGGGARLRILGERGSGGGGANF